MRKNSKKRAEVQNKNIASQRQETLAAAYAWIKYANSSGFYVESICIIESLITDRLESRLSYLLNENIGFQNLKTLIEKTIKEENKHKEKDEKLIKILKNNEDGIMNDLTSWSNYRNEVIHELAKVEADKFIPFHEKKEKAKIVAESGLKLLRKLDNRTTSLRRRKK